MKSSSLVFSGGIPMFLWTSIAHLALPLGEAGIGEIPNESAVLSAMQSNIGDQNRSSPNKHLAGRIAGKEGN